MALCFFPFVREDEYLVNMQHTVIPSWYQREGYITAMANLIEKELRKFDRPEKVIGILKGGIFYWVLTNF